MVINLIYAIIYINKGKINATISHVLFYVVAWGNVYANGIRR